jgi:Ion channel
MLPRLTITPRLRVLLIGIPIFLAHIIGIWIYGIAYFLVENYSSLGRIVGADRTYGMNISSFFDCLYFSAATYTSLGLGDLVPMHDIRMLVGAEVLNGLVMIGWTISFTFLTMEKFWSSRGRSEKHSIQEQ